MAEGETSARLALPLIAAGQAQKEITHNEALAMIDLALAPVIEAALVNSPPASPAVGQAWIVGTAPAAAWTGAAGAIAGWTAAGWRFVQLPVGAAVTVRASGVRWLRKSAGWSAVPSVAAASGGSVVDTECRAALSSLIAALTAQGLLANP